MSLRQYIVKRLLLSVFVLWGVSVLVFLLVRMLPGDPAVILMPPQATEAQVQAYREQLGLTKPYWEQYLIFLGDILTGSLGTSLRYDQSALALIIDRFEATIELTVASVIIAVTISIPAGVISAIKPDTPADYGATFGSLIGVSMPNFWFGILLVLIFGVYLNVLPVFGYPDMTALASLGALLQGNVSPIINFLSHIILPAVALGTYMTAILTRVTRSNMLEQMGREFVKTARAKGISEYQVVTRHILRNALIPFITILGLEFAKLLGGAVVIETVFAWPGVGRLIVEAVSNRDYPIVQAGMLFVATFFVFINLGIDILYTYIDPRIKY